MNDWGHSLGEPILDQTNSQQASSSPTVVRKSRVLTSDYAVHENGSSDMVVWWECCWVGRRNRKRNRPLPKVSALGYER